MNKIVAFCIAIRLHMCLDGHSLSYPCSGGIEETQEEDGAYSLCYGTWG